MVRSTTQQRGSTTNCLAFVGGAVFSPIRTLPEDPRVLPFEIETDTAHD